MVIRSLIDQGVKHVFGYPGGAVLDIYDALHTVGGIEHILVRHEQGAVHMADGYARATGEVGVVLVTSGPGATNAITGIATAYMDSIPLVVISGQVATSLIGYDAFQECDMVGISRPVVKHSYLVKQTEDIPTVLKKSLLSRLYRPPRSGGGGFAERHSQPGQKNCLTLTPRSGQPCALYK
ncbi:acetolactate synthase 3 catalytic subunit, partial [Pseudomonas syringae pv. actinidiae]|nr:acetolactate synthase 3 catalytic subunit [Pseudomonas syringae pv. actinidiae]